MQPQYAEAERFSEGLASITIGDAWGRCGYIEKTGKIIIEPQFYACYDFSRGLAQVVTGEKLQKESYIDKTGKYVWSSTSIFGR